MAWDPRWMISAPVTPPTNQNVSTTVPGSLTYIPITAGVSGVPGTTGSGGTSLSLFGGSSPTFSTTTTQLDWFRWIMFGAGILLALSLRSK